MRKALERSAPERLGTQISARGGWPTVTHELGLSTAYENHAAIFRRVSGGFMRHSKEAL